MKRVRKLPVVCITAIDHMMNTPTKLGEATGEFQAFGLLHKETDTAWYLSTMVFEKDLSDENNEGFKIVKTPGAKKKVLGYVS